MKIAPLLFFVLTATLWADPPSLDRPPPHLENPIPDNSPPDLMSARAAEIARLKVISDDPTATPEAKTAALKLTLKLLDVDTKMLATMATNSPDSTPPTTPDANGPTATPPVQDYKPDETPTHTASGKPLKPGINITDITAKEIEDHDDNVVISWRVTLYNNSDSPSDPLWVTVSCRDSSNFEVDNDLKKTEAIQPKSTDTVTERYTMKKSLWQSVDSYVAKTE